MTLSRMVIEMLSDWDLRTRVALGAGTMEVVHQVDTGSTVLALADTIVEIFSARRSAPAFQAWTLKAARLVLARYRIDAGSVLGGGVRLTLVHVCVEGEKKEVEGFLEGYQFFY